jgi:hypothetical protein
MSRWVFYDYVETSGRVPFHEWLSSLSSEAQAFIDARILQMRGLNRWPEKWVSKYRGTAKLLELRIPYNKVQYRPLGIYAPNWSFIFLAGAIEKNGKIPADVIAAALRRQADVEVNPSHVRRHQFN